LVEPGDLHVAVRAEKKANLVVLVVDASGSMGAASRMAAAKSAVLGLLLDAYQRRDQVALVSFRGEGAEVLLRPTSSVEVARARLRELPTGGRTPLAAGLAAALELIAAVNRAGTHRPYLVVVTDGRATAAGDGVDPVVAAESAAGAIRRRQIDALVVDVEDGATRLGLAARLAAVMGARHLPVAELTSDGLERVVRAGLLFGES
jgi:magnesium chelatase subunit D